MNADKQDQQRQLSRSDFEYLQNVKVKLQKWIEDKRALEETVKSLESKLENKYKALFASCGGIQDLEQKHWGIMDVLESRKQQLQCKKKEMLS